MTTYFIADLHLCHQKIAEIRGFESAGHMENVLRGAWGDVVTDADKVIVAGDLLVGAGRDDYTRDMALERFNTWPGQKILVLGNHDTPAKTDMYAHILDAKLVGALEFKGGIVTHIPVHPSELERFKFNIHGHLHGDSLPAPYYCVSAEHSMQPRTFEEVIGNGLD